MTSKRVRPNPRDEMRSLLARLNSHYALSAEAPTARAYARWARAYARAATQWAELVDPALPQGPQGPQDA